MHARPRLNPVGKKITMIFDRIHTRIKTGIMEAYDLIGLYVYGNTNKVVI